MKEHSWIRDDIDISDIKLPKDLIETMEEMKKLDEQDMPHYFNLLDDLDVSLKELTRMGRITKEQWDLIYTKYKADCL